MGKKQVVRLSPREFLEVWRTPFLSVLALYLAILAQYHDLAWFFWGVTASTTALAAILHDLKVSIKKSKQETKEQNNDRSGEKG